MPTATAPPQGGHPSPAAAPFNQGTYEYSEVMNTVTQTLDANTHEFVQNITPGGFLRGIGFYVTATGGVLGGATAAADNPFNTLSSMTLESIDGTPIKYPMGGYAYMLEQKFCRPWDGDPGTDPATAAGANPAFQLNFYVELRGTLGVVPNTDARAQYRVRFTVNTLAAVLVGGTPTAPDVTITTTLETYAQPPQTLLSGAPVQQVPDGVSCQRFMSHQIDVTTAADQTIKENRVGNLIRNLILVFRDDTDARIDLTSDPIRQRIDNTQLLVEQRARRNYVMNQKYSLYGFNPASATADAAAFRPTGVYVYSRWHEPGELTGQYWLETTEATFLQFEFIGAPAAGTLETITEDLAPVGPIPAYLTGI